MFRKLFLGITASTLFLGACEADNTKEESVDSETALEEKDSITVAVSGTVYPNAYHDEDGLTGYTVGIVDAVAEELGLDVEYVEFGVDGMLTAAKSGQVDLIAEGITPSEDQASGYLISEPIKYSVSSIVVRESDNSGIYSLDDFKGKKAAGESTTDYMQVSQTLGAEPVTYDNATADQYMLDVQNGRTDFIPNDYFVQLVTIGLFEDMDVTVGNVFFNPDTSHFVFNKDQKELLEAFNETIQKFREDGTLSDLSKEFYSGHDVSVKRDEINGIPFDEIPTVEPGASEEEIQLAIEKSLELAQ